MSVETIKNVIFYTIAFAIAVVVACLFSGCAGQMYRAPCEHRVPMEEVNKAEGAVNYCPTCKKPYPYISTSRYRSDDDEIKWYDGFGWHWTGPYYGRPYPYHSYGYGGGGYGYRSYHHNSYRHDDCCR